VRKPAWRAQIEKTHCHRAEGAFGHFVFCLGKNLAGDNIHPSHVLPGQAAKIMPQAGPGSRMLVVVLNQMSNIVDAVTAAPLANLQ
jgi:hypothetical protein